MYKLIATDMDDTLLSEDLTISEANFAALEEAHKQGVKVILCTGRPFKSTSRYAKELKFLNNEDAFVSFNGAVITEVSGKELFTEYMSKDSLCKMVDIAREYDINLQLYSKDDIIVERYNEITMEYERLSSMKALVLDDLKVLDYSMKALFNHPDLEVLEEIRKMIIEKYSDELVVFYSKPTYLEILSVKATKGLAVQHLAEKYGIKADEVIAVGDSYNDAFMIEYAGLGVAIANARSDVKDIADYVTENDHNNSGVAEVINKFILNK